VARAFLTSKETSSPVNQIFAVVENDDIFDLRLAVFSVLTVELC